MTLPFLEGMEREIEIETERASYWGGVMGSACHVVVVPRVVWEVIEGPFIIFTMLLSSLFPT